jgi:antitoxin MazE
MGPAVRARIVRIGNSRGVRIPKVLLDQLNLGDEVEIATEEDHLVVRSVHFSRQGWEEQFRLMAERGDDRLLDESARNGTRWDEEEWEWS